MEVSWPDKSGCDMIVEKSIATIAAAAVAAAAAWKTSGEVGPGWFLLYLLIIW